MKNLLLLVFIHRTHIALSNLGRADLRSSRLRERTCQTACRGRGELRAGVSQVNLVQYYTVKPNLHKSRLVERISTMRTAGNAAPSAPQRQTTFGYDAATGRIATMLANGSNVPFTWSYLPGSDLKTSREQPRSIDVRRLPMSSLNLSAHQVHLAAGHSRSVFSTVKNATVHFSVYQRYWYKYSMGSKMVHVYIVDRVSFTAYSWIDKCIDENVHTFINDVFNGSLQEVTEKTEFLNSDLTPFTPIYNWDFK